MKQTDKRTAALHRIATKKDLLACIVLGFLAVLLPTVVFGAVNFFVEPNLSLWWILPTGLVFYAISLLIWWQVHKARNKAVLDFSLTRLLDSAVGQIMMHMETPIIAVDEKNVLYWMNDAMKQIIQQDMEAADSRTESIRQGDRIPLGGDSQYLKMAGHVFLPQQIATESEGNRYNFILLRDCTELLRITEQYHDERTAVIYIVVDSIDDLMQYVNERFRDALSEVDDKIRRWVSSMNGVIKSYDNDKYIVFIDTQKLEECIENRFSILDTIRTTRVGDGVSVTVSMGVSNMPGTLLDRERSAQSALDLALQRGGDQVVYKKEDGINFFGGKTKAVYKRSNVQARVMSSQIVSLISRAGNVLIMGHKNADFDAFAACVGMARLCFVNGVDFHIVTDKYDKNLAPCFEVAGRIPHLRDCFIGVKEAMDKLKNDTLLIVVDVNNFSIAEAPEVAKRAKTIVVVDHHIKKEELPDTVKVNYIEPTASSASELVSELLEYGINMLQMTAEEAELLLAGILLDTKQFSRNTGTRTFAVAQYLRGQGASTTASNDMFRTDVEDIAKESRLLSSVVIYDENIAIASCDTDTDSSYRVLASKVADKMLTIKGVEASFALVRIRNTVCISGRSHGQINVQLILEDLNGGGHFDAAGAQVDSTDIREVLDRLKASIDKYKKNNK
ncbi:MAG: DHH family phosphoesterase [Clostridia bacterium]|nr:DHH family phosphoesterase [Clostridia bacterium]